MKKSRKYLKEIRDKNQDKRLCDDTHDKVCLIGNKLFLIDLSWDKFFSINNAKINKDVTLNEVLFFGIMMSIGYVNDRIYHWSKKNNSYTKGRKTHLYCLIRNLIAHGDNFVLRGAACGNKSIEQILTISLPEENNDINQWKMEFSKSIKKKFSFYNEYQDLIEEKIIDYMHITYNDIEILDNEFLERLKILFPQ